MALSIMFYHLTNWLFHPLDSSNTLGRLGVYGVSIFFILSGLSMAIVYNKYLTTVQNTFMFFIRRIFRIWPLFWIVCIVITFHQRSITHPVDFQSLILNLTTLFGFYTPADYIPVGAWSIGNEMVYYALTPFFIVAYNYRKWFGNIVLSLTMIIGLYFAFSLLDANHDIASQWSLYVNPFNNLFLYVAGIAIYYNLHDLRIKPAVVNLVLVAAILIFIIVPFKGNHIVIVTGPGRIVFVLLSLIFVIMFYKMRLNLPKVITISLENLGIATYGVYLIHPVIYLYLRPYFPKFPDITSLYLLFCTVSVVTVAFSIILYRTFEFRFINMGKRITTRNHINLKPDTLK